MVLVRYASFIIAFSVMFKVSAAAQIVITTVAGNGEPGFAGDGNPGPDAMLNFPGPLAVDVEGNLYVADLKNHRIRKIGTNGIITTVAGNGVRGFSGDGGRAVDASLDLIREEGGGRPYYPSTSFIVVDGAGNLFFSDTNNHRVRRVDMNGTITTVAGNGIRGHSGDGGPAIEAALNIPSGLALDGLGTLYIADNGNGVIRKITQDGKIETIARGFWWPNGLTINNLGDLYIADSYYDYQGTLFKLDRFGKLTDVSLGAWLGQYFWDSPWAVAVDTEGDILIADYGRVGLLSSNGQKWINLVGGDARLLGESGNPLEVAIKHPRGVALESAGNVYVADTDGNTIRVLSGSFPRLLVDSTYCVGSPWTVQVLNARPGAEIRLFGSSNGAPWSLSPWGTTNPAGAYTETGAFADGTQGKYTLRVQVAGSFSNTSAFEVSKCTNYALKK